MNLPAVNRTRRFDHRQTPCSWNAKCVYSFTDQVFPEHGVESRPAVSSSGIRRLPGAFELQIVQPLMGFHLAQQHGTAITEAGEMTKLMPGVSLSDGSASGHSFISSGI